MSQLLQDDIDWEGMLGEISTTVGAISAGTSFAEITTKLTKVLGKFSTGLSVTVFLIDAKQAKDNQNADTISDAIISFISILGPIGTVISIGLSVAKPHVVKGWEAYVEMNQRRDSMLDVPDLDEPLESDSK